MYKDAIQPVQAFPLWKKGNYNVNGLVQDWSNSSELAMELLQSCIKPSISPYADFLWSA